MLEVHGPLGAFFVWAPAAQTGDRRPVQLIAGGSGVVPLLAMRPAHADADDTTPFRLLYSVRTPDDVFFSRRARGARGIRLRPPRPRLHAARRPTVAGARRSDQRKALEAAVIPAADRPRVYVCGSTGFVETVADWLVELGHDPRRSAPNDTEARDGPRRRQRHRRPAHGVLRLRRDDRHRSLRRVRLDRGARPGHGLPERRRNGRALQLVRHTCSRPSWSRAIARGSG